MNDPSPDDERTPLGTMPRRARSARLRIIGVLIVALGALALITYVGVKSPSSNAAVHSVPLVPVGGVSTLPLNMDVGDAQQVITVVASSASASSAQLQPWERRSGGWVRMGPPAVAHVATGGLTATPNETKTATPLGNFSLTQAFGKSPNPGTSMPFFQLTPADWWISQPGRLYNTHQFCAVACPFTMAAPNTQLFDELRAYNYAVVIDYNRFPPVQGAGSAYFLHVTTAGRPTKGCISTTQGEMVSILRWLNPQSHPRILIGLS